MLTPKSVQVIEVGPRDGFQNIKTSIPTEVKIQEIELLLDAGVQTLQITSFVSPRAVPQMADAKEVTCEILRRKKRAKLFALVPNSRGAENALSCGLTSVSFVISASDAHNRANTRMSTEESCKALSDLIRNYPELRVRVDIATSFGCPFDGEIPMEKVYRVADAAVSAGVQKIMFCDTIGTGNPKQVAEFCEAVQKRYHIPFGFHFHDTRGMGLANILTAMQYGVASYETSVGGLGGCPFAPGAAGNTATEDLLNMLSAMGIQHGCDITKYLTAVAYVKKHIASDLPSHLYPAMKACGSQL